MYQSYNLMTWVRHNNYIFLERDIHLHYRKIVSRSHFEELSSVARFTCSERKRKADNSAEKPPVWILPPISDHYAFLRAKKDLEVVSWLLKKSRFRESFSSKEKELNGLKTITSIAPWIALNTNSREDPLTPTILHLLQNYHKALVHRSKRLLIGKTRRNRGINQYENGASIRQRFPELIIHKYLLVPYCVYASLSDSSRVDNYSVSRHSK